MTSVDPDEPIDLHLHRTNLPFEPADVGEVLRSAQLPGILPEVIEACSAAVRRMPREAIDGLAVTSARRGEGRSTVAMGAALVQRNEYGRKTILLDLDLESPAVPGHGPGIADVLRGDASLGECIRWLAPQFGRLPPGEVRDEAHGLLALFRTRSIVTDLQRAGYAVVADLPPLPPHGAGDRVAVSFSNVLMVVRAGSTPLDAVQAAASGLSRPPHVLLNAKRSAIPRWLHQLVGR